jgi:hypothetical protein
MIGTWPPNDFRLNVSFKVNGFFSWNMRIGELAKISGLAPFNRVLHNLQRWSVKWRSNVAGMQGSIPMI